MNLDLANSQGQGFIKLWYSMKKWEWSDDPNTVCLWVHLLLEANWQDKEWKGRPIKRGQLIFGRKTWAEKTGLSEQQLRTSLNKLISTSNITSESTNQFTVLTIVNYDYFQCKKENTTSHQPATQPTSNQQSNQRVTTPKDCSEFSDCSEGNLKKNLKKKKNDFPKPEDVSEEVWQGWLALRKAKNAPVTALVIKIIRKEAASLSWTLEQAMVESCSRNWHGFKASWVQNDMPRNGILKAASTRQEQNRIDGSLSKEDIILELRNGAWSDAVVLKGLVDQLRTLRLMATQLHEKNDLQKLINHGDLRISELTGESPW
jgi:hypothetical protein